jgi:hypothetical protein
MNIRIHLVILKMLNMIIRRLKIQEGKLKVFRKFYKNNFIQ